MGVPVLKAYRNNIYFNFIIREEKADSIIILPGFPSSGADEEVMKKFYELGFNVFFLNFPGSLQSRGNFLETNPVDDVIDFVKYLKNGKCTSLWDLKEKKFSPKKFILLGNSFSGAIACGVASKCKEIDRLILFSPVVDFNLHDSKKEQDLNALTEFVKRAYENLYRIKFDNLITQLDKFKEISSKNYTNKIGIPFFIFHDPTDETVSIQHSERIIESIKGSRLIEHNLGHGLKIALLNNYSSEIKLSLGIK